MDVYGELGYLSEFLYDRDIFIVIEGNFLEEFLKGILNFLILILKIISKILCWLI